MPIVETQEEDITAFIPTNIISITDGQIYLERGLFQKRFLPAVNVGLSVSRIGSVAQPKPLQAVTKGLRLALSQQKELQKLSQLETTISRKTVSNIHRGELILTLLKQKRHETVRWEEQAVLFYAVEQGYFDDMEMEQSSRFEEFLLELLRNRYPNIIEDIRKTGFTKKATRNIEVLVSDFKQEFFDVDD